jgi:glycosyltransferase involved in cell wall biosynthesis
LQRKGVTVGILTSLDAIRGAERVIDALRLADDLAFDANRDGGSRTIRVLVSALAGDDQLTAISAVHALAQVYDAEADIALSDMLSDDRAFVREHAAWALASRLPRYDTIGRLIATVANGGFGGMLAQRTLEQWSSTAAAHIAIGIEGALLGVAQPKRRYRLFETLGLVRGRIATGPLLRAVADVNESELGRVAAISALGQRRGENEVAALLDTIARTDGHIAEVAQLALVDLAAPPLPPRSDERLSIGQLFLHADIDAGLEHSGQGDNGGIATLLVRLGDALVAANPDSRVLTMSRGSVTDALESVRGISASSEGHVYGRIPLLSDPVQSANAWPLRVAARRGIRRLLRAAGGMDVMHLRMADVGSLAAADVARELDIPVVFTVAPDPHAVINTLDLSGRLSSETFGTTDETEHFWFRARLVQQLAANAAHTVLFPRPELGRDMKHLVGIDITSHPERHTIVPEGIDLQVVDRGVAEATAFAAGGQPSPALAELATLLEELPNDRRGLPLVISVGRFHRVKGMATIVDAWLNGAMHERANLLLIGGDLVNPSADESEQLQLIDALVAPAERREHGLILAGHRPNDTVARWVAAARFGVGELAAPRGIYVCGSLKEEFGIALLEAMGAGLLIVGPDGGGPATYVERGVTGFLAPTWDPARLGGAMVDALDAAQAETTNERPDRSRATVEDSFTIQAMAKSLSTVYAGVVRDEMALREATAII